MTEHRLEQQRKVFLAHVDVCGDIFERFDHWWIPLPAQWRRG
jgi:hypothetical protein